LSPEHRLNIFVVPVTNETQYVQLLLLLRMHFGDEIITSYFAPCMPNNKITAEVRAAPCTHYLPITPLIAVTFAVARHVG
jgi:hypothetical protein